MSWLPKARARVGVLAVTAAVTLASLVVHPPVAANANAALSCPGVLVLGARGSGEPVDSFGGVGATVNTFVTKFRSRLKAQGASMKLMPLVDYPARSVGSIVWRTALNGSGLQRYLAGVDDGVAEGVRKLKAHAKVCPDQRIVLVGYSQGAMVMHRVWLGLPGDVRRRVSAVALIADPDRVRNTAGRIVGAPAARSGSQGIYSAAFADRKDIGDARFPRTRVWQVCTANDIVCDTRVDTLAHARRGVRIHTDYPAELEQVRMIESVAAQAAIATGLCPTVCTLRDTAVFDHPSWNGARLQLLGTDPFQNEYMSTPTYGSSQLVALDGQGRVRWHNPIDAMYDLHFPEPAVDSTGHLFVNYDPGRYNGVIVLAPTANGFDSFQTLLLDGDYSSRFYYADLLGPDASTGQYVIAKHTCDTSCAPGPETDVYYRWDGTDYIAQ